MKIFKRLPAVLAVGIFVFVAYLAFYVWSSASFRWELNRDRDTYLFHRVFTGRAPASAYLPGAYLEAAAMRYLPGIYPATAALDDPEFPRTLTIHSLDLERTFQASATVPLTDAQRNEALRPTFVGRWVTRQHHYNSEFAPYFDILVLNEDQTAVWESATFMADAIYIIPPEPPVGRWSNDRTILTVTFPPGSDQRRGTYTGDRSGDYLHLRCINNAGWKSNIALQSEETADWMKGKKTRMGIVEMFKFFFDQKPLSR